MSLTTLLGAVDTLTRRALGEKAASALQPLEAALAQGPGNALELAQEWAIDHGVYADAVLRRGIRALLRTRLESLWREYAAGDVAALADRKHAFAAQLKGLRRIALHTETANQQHYEVEAEFFRICLGKHLKYSCALFKPGVQNGMSVLDLGCGWGSLTLYIAAKFPKCAVTGLSNSRTQREYIEGEARARGLRNVRIVTADINDWQPEETYERVLSVEMFEHLKNYDGALAKVRAALADTPTARAFVHIFCHRSLPYHFQTGEAQSWLARHFFSGGTMPSFDLLPAHFQTHLTLDRSWAVDGTHYARTARAWLERLDAGAQRAMPCLAKCYGDALAPAWMHRWRVFFIAVEELFAYNAGQEWFVGHYLFRKRELGQDS